ncbi:MAG: sn-glycerol-1-phosphate dehydrogenase, partial [Caldilineaceae bacterium]|nr:sn-glycerol-1-phosphate dehydrogenase [Caldilineaceae bacterium]
VDHLLAFCNEHDLREFVVVSDRNTRHVLGERVEAALRGQGYSVLSAFFDEEKPVADAHHIFHVMLACDAKPRTFVAVGSGTITDITRFASHRTHAAFLSMPTAPSVDGFTSIGAPLIIDGIKTTVVCQPPRAIFADLAVLANAPRAMIAAGFGDMMGKFTSVADFRLGRLLRGEPFDEEIAQRTAKSAQMCVDHAAEIATASPEGVRHLMDALVESGYCMLDFGDSRPASGTEHHYSHFWEMKLLREGRPPILHGAKVGYGTIRATELYERLGRLSRDELSDLLEAATVPDRAEEIARIEAAYGELAPDIIKTQRYFLEMTEAEFDALKARIWTHWAEIQAIGAALLPSAEFRRLLQLVGGPTTPAALGLRDEEIEQGVNNAHYFRDRFTVRKLWHLLGE